MKPKNQIIRVLDVVKKHFDKKNVTSSDMMLLVNDIYFLIIDDSIKKFAKSTTKLSFEDYEDYADIIIDLSNIIVLSGIRCYSLDTTSAPYELPHEKMLRLKKHLSRILASKKDNLIGNEIYSWLFNFAYLQSINNASKNRKSVLSEQKKSTPTKEKNGK